jgi:peptide methionine sulfoxide reductase MsrB
MLARGAGLRCIKVPRSSTPGAGGPPSSMVSKFSLDQGGPALMRSLAIPGAINRHEDKSFFTTRTEITCAACGGHLGHVFKGEGFDTPSTCAVYQYNTTKLFMYFCFV